MAYSIAVILAIVFALGSIATLDKSVALYFHSHPLPFFHIITLLGNAAPYILGGGAAYIFYRKTKPLVAKKGLYLLSSILLSGIITTSLKILIGRPRPKLFFHEHLFTPHFFALKAKFWSMPSGHTTTAFAAGVSLGFIFPKYRYLFWFLALLVAMSRVVLTQHYISDVIIAATIGSLTAIILYKRIFGAQ